MEEKDTSKKNTRQRTALRTLIPICCLFHGCHSSSWSLCRFTEVPVIEGSATLKKLMGVLCSCLLIPYLPSVFFLQYLKFALVSLLSQSSFVFTDLITSSRYLAILPCLCQCCLLLSYCYTLLSSLKTQTESSFPLNLHQPLSRFHYVLSGLQSQHLSDLQPLPPSIHPGTITKSTFL